MISEDLAVAKGINVAQTNLLYLFLVSVVVAIGIQIVGTLLVGFLVIVPAIAAKNLSTHMRSYSILSAVFGAISGFVGVLVMGHLLFRWPSTAIPRSNGCLCRHHNLCSNSHNQLETKNNQHRGDNYEEVHWKNINRHHPLPRQQNPAHKTQHPPLRRLLGAARRTNGPRRNHRANRHPRSQRRNRARR